MKKLLVLLVLLVSGTLFSQTFKLSDTVGRFQGHYDSHFDYDSILNQYVYVKELVREPEPLRDSLKREFIQVESVKKLNKIRKDLGMKPLIYDERLKPAAYHNLVYNRYCQWNNIFQPEEGNTKLTHIQTVDIPNFTEIYWPDQRISLLEKDVFSKITEELTSDIIWPTWTFDEVTNRPWDRYKICSAHWSALTKSTEWDAIYFYRDTKTGIHVVILGKYKT